MAQGLQSLTKQEKFRNTVATILARLLTSLLLPHENDDSSSPSFSGFGGFGVPGAQALRTAERFTTARSCPTSVCLRDPKDVGVFPSVSG